MYLFWLIVSGCCCCPCWSCNYRVKNTVSGKKYTTLSGFLFVFSLPILFSYLFANVRVLHKQVWQQQRPKKYLVYFFIFFEGRFWWDHGPSTLSFFHFCSFLPVAKPSGPRTVRVVVLVVWGEQFVWAWHICVSTVQYFGFINSLQGVESSSQPVPFCLTSVLWILFKWDPAFLIKLSGWVRLGWVKLLKIWLCEFSLLL